jgi:hypothetical protein
MTMPIELFVSDITNEVRVEAGPREDTFVLRGLPILQPGTWNGKGYADADMDAIAANFAEVQHADAWEPPMRPFHGYDNDGKPLVQDARETSGWFKAMRRDPATGRLVTDVEVDRDTARAVQSGKLRYTSAEIVRSGYTSPVTGKTFDTPVCVGAAWVTNPAVKGMPWNIVCNAAEYGQPLDVEPLGDREGEMTMPEETKTVETLAVAPPVPAPPPSPEVLAQLEQMQQANKELAAQVETLAVQARSAQVKATVDGWVTGGVVPPALRVQAFALVDALAQSGGEVEVLADAAGATRKVGLVELLGELLEGLKPGLQFKPQADVWQGRNDTLEVEPTADEVKATVAAMTGSA